MQLYYIRHAQSENNALFTSTGNYSGRSMDPELTDTGRKQAILLGQFLKIGEIPSAGDEVDFQNRKGIGLTHIYTSLMVRAVLTGEILAEALGIPLIAWEDIHETGGIFYYDSETGKPLGQPGKDRSYFEAHHPGLILSDAMNDSGWWDRPFEPTSERTARAGRVFQTLQERHGNSDDRIALVSHGGFYNHLIMAMQGLEKLAGFWYLMNNAALSRFDFNEEGITLAYHNRLDYLPDQLVT